MDHVHHLDLLDSGFAPAGPGRQSPRFPAKGAMGDPFDQEVLSSQVCEDIQESLRLSDGMLAASRGKELLGHPSRV